MSQSSGRTLSSRKGVRFAREEESLEEEIARKFSEPQQTHFSFVVDEARREKVRKQRQQHLVSIGEDVNSPKRSFLFSAFIYCRLINESIDW